MWIATPFVTPGYSEVCRFDSAATVEFFQGPRHGDVIHIYKLKSSNNTPHSPNATHWFITLPSWRFYRNPDILKDGTGTTFGTWKQMNDNGFTWSLDGNTWYDFTGKIVWAICDANSKGTL